jgi:hypothetical protein
VENFLGIELLKTNKLGKFNHIKGGNGVGKSSIVKAIKEAFQSSGKSPELIRIGEDRAQVIVKLGDEIEIKRNIAETTNTVKVTKDGQPIQKAQTFLNELFGPGLFDPTEFFNSKPADRRDMILRGTNIVLTKEELAEYLGEHAASIDLNEFDYSGNGLSVLEDIQKRVYDHRAELNREVTQLDKAIQQEKAEIPDTFDADKFKDFDFSVKMKEYDAAVAIKNDHAERQREYDRKVQRYDEIQKEIAALNAEMEKVVKEGKVLKSEIDKYQEPDTEVLKGDLDEFQSSQKILTKIENIENREREIELSRTNADEMDAIYKILTKQAPKKMVAKSKLPVEGMEFKGNDILVNGVSIDTLSTSQQIQFAIKVARFLSQDRPLKVICVDGFERLEEEARAAFINEASDDGYEYFITQVTSGELQIESGGKSQSEMAL